MIRTSTRINLLGLVTCALLIGTKANSATVGQLRNIKVISVGICDVFSESYSGGELEVEYHAIRASGSQASLQSGSLAATLEIWLNNVNGRQHKLASFSQSFTFSGSNANSSAVSKTVVITKELSKRDLDRIEILIQGTTFSSAMSFGGNAYEADIQTEVVSFTPPGSVTVGSSFNIPVEIAHKKGHLSDKPIIIRAYIGNPGTTTLSPKSSMLKIGEVSFNPNNQKVVDKQNCSGSSSSILYNSLSISCVIPSNISLSCTNANIHVVWDATNIIIDRQEGVSNINWDRSVINGVHTTYVEARDVTITSDLSNGEVVTGKRIWVNSSLQPVVTHFSGNSASITAVESIEIEKSAVFISEAGSVLLLEIGPCMPVLSSEPLDDSEEKRTKTTHAVGSMLGGNEPHYGENVKELNEERIIIFPNPATDRISISGLNERYAKISVFDVFGKAVLIKNGHYVETVDLDISHLDDGLYVLSIEHQGIITTLKFIRE